MNAAQVLIAWADLAATTTLVGGLAYAALIDVPQPRGRSALVCAVCLLGVALLLEISLNAVRMQRVSGIGGTALLVDVFEMKWSHWWVLRVLALGAIGTGVACATPPWAFLAAIGTASLLARSLQGHAGAHGTIPALVDWIHLSAASAWVGGLLQLVLLPAVSLSVATRASKLFTIALGPLVLGGIYGALLHVATPSRLVGTPYGRVLLGKMALAAVAVTFGALNHYRNVPALGRGERNAGRRLLHSVRVEVLLVIVLLLLSAALGVLPMPHAM